MSYIEIKAKRESPDLFTGCCFLDGRQLEFERYGFHKASCDHVREVFNRVSADFAGLSIHCAIELQGCLFKEFSDDSVNLGNSLPANCIPGVVINFNGNVVTRSAVICFDHAYIGIGDTHLNWFAGIQMPVGSELSIGTRYFVDVPGFTGCEVLIRSSSAATPGAYVCDGIGEAPHGVP